MSDTLEMRVYQLMCAGCEYERKCHEECEHCDEYYDKLRELAAEEYFNNEHRFTARHIIKDGTKYYCPNCRALIGNYPYCKYCGQDLGRGR